MDKKAPDKIYLSPVGTWDTEHIPDLQDNIYIRKDALLEYLEGRFNDERNRNLINFGGVVTGTQALVRAEAFKEVIDKLNEM